MKEKLFLYAWELPGLLTGITSADITKLLAM
jgi:hypothetical protein